jgi:hypothetical protein
MTEHGKEEPEVVFDPAVGRFVSNPRSSTWESAPSRRTVGLVFALVWLLTPIVGFFIWVVYVFEGEGEGASVCGSGFLFGPSWSGGGQASGGSAITAALIGLVLWVAAGLAWRIVGKTDRARLVLVVVAAGFTAEYLLLLTGLWYVSPLIWGPRYC